MSKITCDREKISVKAAKEYLALNTNNRGLSAPRVLRIAGAIERGEWEENGATISFDDNGELVDGQHRLAAIVKANKGVYSLVVRGLSSEAQGTVDTGKPRSARDVLAIRGFTSAGDQASIARLVLEHQTNGIPIFTNTGSSPTVQQVVNWVEDEPNTLAYARYANWFVKQDPSLGLPKSLVGALFFLFEDAATHADALDFFNNILAPSSASSPMAKVRQRLQKGNSTLASQRLVPRSKAAVIIKAWNAYILGETPSKILFKAGGKRAEKFPEILSPQEEN